MTRSSQVCCGSWSIPLGSHLSTQCVLQCKQESQTCMRLVPDIYEHQTTYPGRLVCNRTDSVAAKTLQRATEERPTSVPQKIRATESAKLCSSWLVRASFCETTTFGKSFLLTCTAMRQKVSNNCGHSLHAVPVPNGTKLKTAATRATTPASKKEKYSLITLLVTLRYVSESEIKQKKFYKYFPSPPSGGLLTSLLTVAFILSRFAG